MSVCGGVGVYEQRGVPPGLDRPGQVHQSGGHNQGGHAGRPGGPGGRDPGAIDEPGGQGTDGGPSPGGGSSAGPGKSGGAAGGPTTIGASGPGHATLDVGGAKVDIQGPGAEKYAQALKEWTDKNPEMKRMVQEAAKANPNGQFEIKISDLGKDPKDPQNRDIAGQALPGQLGKGNMQYGAVEIDTGDFSKDVLIHEMTHNNGWRHETPADKAAMDAEIRRISAMG
jgi:hypothetical protein